MEDASGHAFPPVMADTSPYPYPVRPRGWALYIGLSTYVLTGAMLLIGCFISLKTLSATPANVVLLLPLLLVGAIISAQLWRLYRPSVVLYADHVEVSPLFGSRRSLPRSQIRGVGRTIYSRSGSYFDIIPRSEVDQAVRLPASARGDPVVVAWLAGAHDPDAEIKAAERAAVLADPRFGDTEAKRARRLDRAKRLSGGFAIVCMAAAVWIVVSRQTYAVSLSAPILAPFIAWLLIKYADGLILWVGKTRTRPQVGIIAAVPAVALGFASFSNSHLYDAATPLLVATGLGLIAGVTVYARTKASTSTADPLSPAVIIGVALGAGVFGWVTTANIALDGAKPRAFVTQVLNKYAYHGKSTRYTLTLTGWAGRANGDVDVESAVYDEAVVGAPMCAYHHPGAFRLPWYTISLCVGPRPESAAAAQASDASDVGRSPNANSPTANTQGFYPERAQRLEVEGEARMACRVTETLTLTDCRVLSESPSGYGFGAAAKARLEAGPITVKSVQPGGVFQTKVSFRLEK